MKYKYFLLILMLSSCGGGGGGGDSSGPQVPPTPSPTVNLSADPLSVLLNDTSTLSWSSTNASSCSASWTSQTSTSGSETVTISTAGDSTYSISCTGTGGTSSGSVTIRAFALTLASGEFSTNEDTEFDGSIAASANEAVTLNYAITSQTTNGSINLNSSGAITYIPNTNFYGTDNFDYSVTAVEKNLTKSATANITINAVNDAPSIIIDTYNNLNKENLIFESNPSYNVTFSDIDNDLSGLTFSASLNDEIIPSVFSALSDGYGSIELDLSSINRSGYLNAKLIVSDGSENASSSFNTWFIANKSTVTISQDDDRSDGFDSGTRTDKDYYVYELIGNSNSTAGTKWLFVADSLADETDVTSFRTALLESINLLNESDISSFFAGYFDIVVAEPVEPDGTSAASIETGCYDWDEDVYCIGSGDIDTSIFQDLLSDNDLISVLTMQQGRGVNLGNTNIQQIKSSTSVTVMHELGHAHGEMGDEYRSDDDRDVSSYADLNINTTTQNDISLLKWNHHIEDELNVLGKDVLVCYNYGDGTIADWDDRGITVDQCGCFANEWSASPNSSGGYNFIRKNPECGKVGLFEGNYYGVDDNYRPTFCSVMDSCSSGGYGKVNAEGFAIGSIVNQGFEDDSVGFISNTGSNSNDGFQITLNVEYDETKITLEWYKNGIKDETKTNQTSVIFSRPADNGVDVYTWRAVDLTGYVIAPDSVTDDNDFYEGLFNTSFIWRDSTNEQWVYDPNDQSLYNYGYMVGPLGGKWGINWGKY